VKAVLALLVVASPLAAQTVTDGDTLKQRRDVSALGHRRARSQAGVPRWLACGQSRDDQAAGTDYRPLDRLPGEGPRPLRPDSRHLPSVRRRFGRIMVQEGLAWAFTRFSVDYVDQQEESRIANRGLHAHDCAPAWEWRAQQRARTASSA
jgi:hypothetical protein